MSNDTHQDSNQTIDRPSKASTDSRTNAIQRDLFLFSAIEPPTTKET
jgi:hypothetical protein